MAEKVKQMYTPEGYKELVDELNYLKLTRREEIKEAIAVARSFGDLSENAEYDEARTEQAKVEARILELDALIENAIVIDESTQDFSLVSLGSFVKLLDKETGEEITYSIVGSNEADPFLNRISDMSPIGKALVGKRAGDEVVVEAPSGNIVLQIVEVTR